MKNLSNLIGRFEVECKDIIRYVNEIGKESFLKNDIYQKATAMSLLNIGEHSNALTRELRFKYQDIQWRKIVDLRNIVAHGYGELKNGTRLESFTKRSSTVATAVRKDS